MPLDTTPRAADEDDFIDDAPPEPVDVLEQAPAAEDQADDGAEESTDDALAPEAPKGETPKGEAAAADAPADTGAPVTIKVGGRDIAIDGLVQRPDGSVHVPKEHRQAYLDLIRDGVHHRTSFREQLASVKDEAQQTVHAAQTEVARAKAEAASATQLLNEYDRLIAEKIGSPEAAERFLGNYPYEMQLLQRDLQLVQQRVQTIVPEAPAAPDPIDDDEFVASEVARHAGQMITEQFRDVFGEHDYKSIAQYVQATARQYLKPADQDYPDLGVRKGEMVVNLPALNAYLRSLAAGRTLATDANRAAAANAASPGATRTAPSSTARPNRPASAPPAMTSRAATATAAPAHVGPPRNAREWEASLRQVTGSVAGDSDFDL